MSRILKIWYFDIAYKGRLNLFKAGKLPNQSEIGVASWQKIKLVGQLPHQLNRKLRPCQYIKLWSFLGPIQINLRLKDTANAFLILFPVIDPSFRSFRYLSGHKSLAKNSYLSHYDYLCICI